MRQGQGEKDETKRERYKQWKRSSEGSCCPSSLSALSAVQLRSGPLQRCSPLCYVVIFVIDHRFVALWSRCFVWVPCFYWHSCVFLSIATLPAFHTHIFLSLHFHLCCPVTHTIFPFQRSISSIRSKFADCCIIYHYREGGDALLKAQLTPSVFLSPLISPW